MSRARASLACLFCLLALVPQTLTSPDQLIHIFISLVEAASGRPWSNGTGCSPPNDRPDEALNEEFLELVMNVSDVAVVLDHEGRRPGGRSLESADSANETTTESGLIDRALTNAVPNFKTCPRGQLRDRAGKCRTVISSARVWAT